MLLMNLKKPLRRSLLGFELFTDRSNFMGHSMDCFVPRNDVSSKKSGQQYLNAI